MYSPWGDFSQKWYLQIIQNFLLIPWKHNLNNDHSFLAKTHISRTRPDCSKKSYFRNLIIKKQLFYFYKTDSQICRRILSIDGILVAACSTVPGLRSWELHLPQMAQRARRPAGRNCFYAHPICSQPREGAYCKLYTVHMGLRPAEL